MTLTTLGNKPKFSAIFFDLDGTLADTAPDLCGAMNRLLAELGLPPKPIELMRAYASQGARGLLNIGLDILPEHPDYNEHQQRFLALYEQHICDQTVLFPGFSELLSKLESAGIKWGIVTNKHMRFTAPLCAALGLDTRAAAIVGGDSAARAKPAPDPILLACEIAAIEPTQALYVGDDERDIIAGRAAGLKTAAACYGYIVDPSTIPSWQADYQINNAAELAKLLA